MNFIVQLHNPGTVKIAEASFARVEPAALTVEDRQLLARQFGPALPPVDEAAVKQARETGDKEALRLFREKRQGLVDLRKGYLDKFRATLTAEQKTKLDTVLEELHSKQPRGQQHPKPTSATPPAE